MTNLDNYESIETHWIELFVKSNNRRESCNGIYFDTFGVEYTPKEIKEFIGNKNIITNIYRIQGYDLDLCGYFSVGFIDVMLKDKSLLEYTNLFFPNDYENNDKIILNYFQ